MSARRGAVVAVLVSLTVIAAPATSPAETAADYTRYATGDTTGLEDLSAEELFIRASSSALQFEHLRAPARRALIRDHESTLPYLLTRLDTDNPRERLALEDVVVKIGEPALPSLTDAFSEELENIHTSRGARLASTLLGRIGGEEAARALEHGAAHGEWKVRSSVASGLGRAGSRDSVQSLLFLLGDSNEIVRKSAAAALARTARKNEGEIGERATAALAAALDDPCHAVRDAASRALGACGERALEPLESVLDAAEEPSLLHAIDALGLIGGPRARSDLRRLLASRSWVARARAAAAMTGIELGRSERASMKKLLTDPHPLVSSTARSALAGS